MKAWPGVLFCLSQLMFFAFVSYFTKVAYNPKVSCKVSLFSNHKRNNVSNLFVARFS